jgi:hypothetical protein
MADLHDPTALVRHAIESGDWRLAELLLGLLSSERGSGLGAVGRVYLTLTRELGLAGGGD